MSRRRYRLHVVSHTRWDREWYEPHQSLRFRQVALMDRLIDTLANRPEFTSFMLDGQTILLDDYLEVRSDQRALITELVQEGRLEIGPWYVLPNEYLVSAEALIRNLQTGLESAEALGARMNIGYLPTPSGHIAQMPQILRGFGLWRAALVYGPEDAPLEFMWESPDGSQVMTSYLRDGYDNANRLPTEEDELKAALVRARDALREYSTTGVLLLMSGGDYDDVQPQTPELLAGIQKRFRGTRVIHSSLAQYFEDLQQNEDGSAPELPVLSGELRPSRQVYPAEGITSSRVGLKQRNQRIQSLLENWAEPFGTWAAFLNQDNGSEDQARGLSERHSTAELSKLAWRILLQNHQQDSLGGNCVDQVAAEMDTRFDQAEQLTEQISLASLETLTDQINTAELGDTPSLLPIVVFNGSSQFASEVVTTVVTLQEELWPATIVDEAGAVVPSSVEYWVEDEGEQPEFPLPVPVSFLAADVPPFGYRTYAVRAGSTPGILPRYDDGLSIENEFLSITVDPTDGTLSLFDKRTGRSYPGLNQYIDGGDRGDTYNYCPPEKDTLIDIAANTPLQIERRISEVEQVIEFLQIYRLPNSLSPDRASRLPLAVQFVPISIVTTLRAARGVPRVDVMVSVSNGARDHRLRVHFPVGGNVRKAFFDGPFIVGEQAIEQANGETDQWDIQTREIIQKGFITLAGDDTGLTIANRGIPEAALLQRRSGTEIALTLLRCVGWLSRDDLQNRQGSPAPMIETPGAQCQGDHVFEYSIIPHGPDPLPAWQEAWAYQSPPQVQQAGYQHGPMPLSASLVQADNPLFILSAVKIGRQYDDLIVRGYSISDQDEVVNLQAGLPVSHAERVRMDETPLNQQQALETGPDGSIRFTVHPYEVVTIRLVVDQPVGPDQSGQGDEGA